MGYQPGFEVDSETALRSLFPDFLLATAFFTALIYAALSHRFPRRTSAVAALATGLALAIGLTWWEADQGLSVRNLGPIAVGFGILLLAAVMYRVLSEIGGQFAGVALTLGASILLGWILGLSIPVPAEVLQTVTTVALVVGILALVAHRHPPVVNLPYRHHRFPQNLRVVPAARNDLRGLYQDRQLGGWLRRALRGARHEADFLHEHPELEDDVLIKLKRMFPAEGYLTERLARLRERAHHVRKGHVARIEELREAVSKAPPEIKRKLGEELASRFKELKLDLRLERLDRACAEMERRIRQLTAGAAEALQRHDYRRVTDLLESAEKLQAHNARLFKIIDRTEKKLITISQHVAQQTPEVNQP
jgi:hypothetical protein